MPVVESSSPTLQRATLTEFLCRYDDLFEQKIGNNIADFAILTLDRDVNAKCKNKEYYSNLLHFFIPLLGAYIQVCAWNFDKY